jgi:transposase
MESIAIKEKLDASTRHKLSHSRASQETTRRSTGEFFDEWVSLGNQREDFQKKRPKIIIILDNASYHKRLNIREKIAVEMSNLVLEFLPAYSSDFNIIELVWHSCKEYIAPRLFQSVNELKELLERLLNHGELIIKWHRKIKNQGNNHVAT